MSYLPAACSRGLGVIITALLVLTTSVGLASPAIAEYRGGDGSAATARQPDVYPPSPSTSTPPTGPTAPSTARFCVGGVGGDCDEWYTNFYNNKVLVTDELNDYVKSKHGISKGMIRWVIANGPRADFPVRTATRQGYSTAVRRIDCDPSCHDAGVQVNIRFVVEWAGYGADRGELVTMYCNGYSGLCPSWIRAL